MFFATDHDDPNVHVDMLSGDLEALVVREWQIEIGSAPVTLVPAVYKMHHRRSPRRSTRIAIPYA
jgi:hypothetical protein